MLSERLFTHPLDLITVMQYVAIADDALTLFAPEDSIDFSRIN